ncbi:tetratricopeptide repeat protein [Nocardia sp. NPDC003482]
MVASGADVFVSYRTLDSRYGTADAHEYLVQRFGASRVFLDFASMDPAAPYPDEIRAALERARVLVVMIGPNWAGRAEGAARGAIDDDRDWIRREVRRALEREIPVLPVLFDGAAIPLELPPDIAELRLRQALTIGHKTLAADRARLADTVVGRVPELALPDLFESPVELPATPLPSELLRPEHRVVDFDPLDELYDTLRAWLSSSAPLEVRLVVGPGGRGKSRLAAELIRSGESAGMHAGFVRAEFAPVVLERIRVVRGGLLLVVDYADSRPGDVVTILNALLDRPADLGPARVLLLARSAGEWTRVLERHENPALAGLAADLISARAGRVEPGERRRERFLAAVERFGEHLGVAPDRAGVPGDLDDDRYDQILDLHAAALAAVLDVRYPDARHGDSRARTDPVLRVLHHEERYWIRSAPRHGLPARPEELRVAVAAATLAGAEDRGAARALLSALRPIGPDEPRLTRHLAWLTQLYPGAAALNPLRPDRLGEDLVALVLTDGEYACPTLAADLSPILDARQVFRAFTVLARMADRHRDVSVRAMADLLGAETASRVGIAIAVAALTGEPTLAAVIGELRGGIDLSETIVANLPDTSLALAELGAAHTERLLAHELGRPDSDPEFVAELRHNLAQRLSEVGERDAALVMAAEAVRDYRALPRGPLVTFELAGALTLLAGMHGDLGHHDQAIEYAEEAVRLLDDATVAAAVEPGEFTRTHVTALLALADMGHELGHDDRAAEAVEKAVAILRTAPETADSDPDRRERLAFASDLAGSVHRDPAAALRATRDAADMYRELDAENPDRYRDSLVRVLGNLAEAHGRRGDWQAALDAGDEATELARAMIRRYGEKHLVALATSLNNAAVALRRGGHPDLALARYDEADPIHRRLSDRIPGVHLRTLADARTNHGNALHDTGRHAEAIDAYEEASEIYRKLSGPDRAGVNESLADALVGAALARIALSDDDESLRAAWSLANEAVDLLENVRDTPSPRPLAAALHLAATIARDLGMTESAERDAARAAVLLERAVSGSDPLDTRSEYGAALHLWACTLDERGDHDHAAAVFGRAIEVYRDLGDSADLADTLVDAGTCESERPGGTDTALEFVVEAVGRYRALVAEGGDPLALARALNNLADLYHDSGEPDRARACAAEAVSLCEKHCAEPELGVYVRITHAYAVHSLDAAAAARSLAAASDIARGDRALRAVVREAADELGIDPG